MPRIALLALLLVSLLPACASPQLWSARTTPGCYQRSGDPELDRERTYVAALLALNERGYAILHAEAPREIEADFASSYRPEISHTRWLITIQPDASLLVDTPPNMREVHQRSERWYGNLVGNVQRLQCRDLNWLRWEAQNRGLLPIGAAGIAMGPAPSAGGEQAITANGLINPHAQRLAELERQRADLHVSRAITWSAVGAGFGR